MKSLSEILWMIKNELRPSALTHRKALSRCKKHFNEIGIYAGYQIGRLIGFGEGDDFYYLIRSEIIDWDKPDGRDYKDTYCSMVGGWYSIKKMGKKGYNYTERNLKLPKAEKFIETYWEDE